MRIRNNTILIKLKKDLKNVLSILSDPSSDYSEQSLDSYIPTSSEDAKIIEQLKESEIKLR